MEPINRKLAQSHFLSESEWIKHILPAEEDPYLSVIRHQHPTPSTWLIFLLLLGGDIHPNPGPHTHTHNYSCNTGHKAPSLLNTHTTISKPTSTRKHTNPMSKMNTFKILQFNANGIRNKVNELQLLTERTNADIITIQESKLQPNHKTPNIHNYTTIRTDRQHKQGGGLLTFVKNNIKFSQLDIPNTTPVELQIVKIHLSTSKHIHVANMYIPPRDTNQISLAEEDTIITKIMMNIISLPQTLITADINAHSPLWYSPIKDHRGELIEDILLNSNQITLNTNTPTRIPPNTTHQPTSPDITTTSADLHNHISWETIHSLTG